MTCQVENSCGLPFDASRIIIIVFGPPGSRKGALARKIYEMIGVPLLSTDDMLEIGNRIAHSDCARGFVLDGIPHTVAQAQQLDRMLRDINEKVSIVLDLYVSPEGSETNIDAGDLMKYIQHYQEHTVPLLRYYATGGIVKRVDADREAEEIWPSVASSLSGRQRNIVLLFGPPGCGKGTQAPKIVAQHGIPHLCAADLADNKFDKVALGGVVPDNLMVDVIRQRIAQADCSNGFILHGFPHNTSQAKLLDRLLEKSGDSVGCVLAFDVPDYVVIERICGRWHHKKSGRGYHVPYKRPESLPLGTLPTRINMLDDATGEKLVQRPQDVAAVFKLRLREYHAGAEEVLDHYRSVGLVKYVNANQVEDSIAVSINIILKQGLMTKSAKRQH